MWTRPLPFKALAFSVLAGCSSGATPSDPIADTPDGASDDTAVSPDDAATADIASEPEVLAADGGDSGGSTPIVLDPPPPDNGIHGFASGCYAVQVFDGVNAPNMLVGQGETFAFAEPDPLGGARFRLRAADLGTYVLYDVDRHYVTASAEDPTRLARPAKLDSSLSLMDDAFVSPAEWMLEPSTRDPKRYRLHHRQSGQYLAATGLVPDEASAGIITLLPREGCVDYPELTVDATGDVTPHSWDDGSVYGIAEIHAHLMTNMGFGGGSIFHGAVFHREGVEYALPDCAPFHGDEGRRDIVSFFYDGNVGFDIAALVPVITNGHLDSFNHTTAGYPDFTQWPNAHESSTHQVMYYRWLERAYKAGLRLLVNHATGNSVLCDIIVGIGAQKVRYDCNDMVGVDHTIAEMRSLQRYIDAQAGGPGKGWLRIVESPAEARAAVGEGKLAVVLGIEISNLFNCFSTPKPGYEACTAESVAATLDHYHSLGVRAVFPVHKYDNGFSAGDGSSGIIELGNLVNSGHYSNFIDGCPGPHETFDGGDVTFGGLNKPREHYDDPPPLDTSGFKDDLITSLLPHLTEITAPALQGDYCQKTGLTPLGEGLIRQLMKRGMIIDIAHLPQRSVARAYELLEENNYPATKTHGQSTNDRLYGVGGLTGVGLGGCSNPDVPGAMSHELRERTAHLMAKAQYPGQPIAYDLNGFAGAPGPRFGPTSGCSQPQTKPVTYPFTSYDGQVTFTQPHLGSREVDFNTEGLVHVGLLPEMIEDVRKDGATDQDMEPLFRSAEAWIRMWERAEKRGAEL